MQSQGCSLSRIMPGGSLVEAELPVSTVTALVPLLPSLVALIVAAPAATAVTSPLSFTVATEALLHDQMTTRPGSGVLSEVSVRALSCACPPSRIWAVAGLTFTTLTEAVTRVRKVCALSQAPIDSSAMTGAASGRQNLGMLMGARLESSQGVTAATRGPPLRRPPDVPTYVALRLHRYGLPLKRV